MEPGKSRSVPAGNLVSLLNYPGDPIGAELWICGICGQEIEDCTHPNDREDNDVFLMQFGQDWLREEIHSRPREAA